ncbi:MAG TPA: flagellar export chaperone FlgN [Candidatus Methylacidiphilales bacterium]
MTTATETLPAETEAGQIVLQQLEEMLDELIKCQREEQECILNRDVTRLPTICEKITLLTSNLERHQLNLKTFIQARPLSEAQDRLRAECVKKFRRMQDLAQQNHMLLENSLRFLQQVMCEFLGAKRKQTTYNHMGTLSSAFAGSGLLMDVKV